MQNTTELEKKIYNELLDICFSDSFGLVEDLVKNTGYRQEQIKGVISSLSKKGLVECEEDLINGVKYNCIRPIINLNQKADAMCFGWDYFTKEEKDSFKI